MVKKIKKKECVMPGKKGAVLFLLCISANSFAAGVPFEHLIRDQCADRYFSQVEVQSCVRKHAADSRTVLQKAQTQVAAEIRQWDEETGYKDAALKKYEAAEKSFAAYRDRYCDWAASLGGGAIGTALEMRKNACIAEQNRTHAGQLREMIKNRFE